MKLSLNVEQSQRQEQKLTARQRQEMRQEMVLTMAGDMENLRDETSGPPDDILKNIISNIVSRIKDENSARAITSLLGDEDLRQAILDEADILFKAEDRGLHNTVLRYFYKKHNGEFTVASQEEGEAVERKELLKIPMESFNAAVEQRSKLEKEYEVIENIVKSGKPSADATQIERMREIRNSLTVADSSKESLELIEKGLRFAFKVTGSDQVPILPDFLRELTVLRRFDPYLSDRIQKRFVTRFIDVRENTDPERLKVAMLNVVAEYTLVSMGILSPEVFSLQKTNVDRKAYTDFKEDLQQETGVDLDQLMKHYALRGPGTIFWNRWHVLGKKLGPVTDDKIREFITKTFRRDGKKVLEAIDYQSFFEKIKEITSNARSREEKQEAVLELRTLLTDSLGEEGVKDKLADLIKVWLGELSVFYSK